MNLLSHTAASPSSFMTSVLPGWRGFNILSLLFIILSSPVKVLPNPQTDNRGVSENKSGQTAVQAAAAAAAASPAQPWSYVHAAPLAAALKHIYWLVKQMTEKRRIRLIALSTVRLLLGSSVHHTSAKGHMWLKFVATCIILVGLLLNNGKMHPH